MKFTSFFVLASLAAGALAQSINIGYPADGATITPGSALTVQVNRPNSLTGSQEVAIVISLLECPSVPCPAPSDRLGSTLYAGGYNPQYPTAPSPQDEPQQNFTVTVPSSFSSGGTAQLSVTHLSLVGAGPFPLIEIRNVTLKVQ
ncbi:hypothetical protein BC834DRAFT_533665 [Gloeopeniophorella convolvens]|nr:hypothetical protein BC834DRAFT_533665 [Gloeopeniophorella convolvens]